MGALLHREEKTEMLRSDWFIFAQLDPTESLGKRRSAIGSINFATWLALASF
jgi:hypothetical protein